MICRFVNSDDDVLIDRYIVINLFNYCDNVPTGKTDNDGLFGIPGLVWPGEIHRAVQIYIKKQDQTNSIEYEVEIVSITGNKRRIDLVNFRTGEIWEIKPILTLSGLISEQIDEYLHVFLYTSRKVIHAGTMPELKKGNSLTHGQFIYQSILGDKYQVSYVQTEDGVIRYTFAQISEATVTVPVPDIYGKRKKRSNKRLLSNVTAFGLLAGGGALLCYFADEGSYSGLKY